MTNRLLRKRIKNIEAHYDIAGDVYLPRENSAFIDKEHLDCVREVKNKLFVENEGSIPSYESYRTEILHVLQSKGFKMSEETIRDDYGALCEMRRYFDDC